MKVVTVIDHTGMQRTFKADKFSVDENGYLSLRADDDVVAVFAVPTWHAVFYEEARS